MIIKPTTTPGKEIGKVIKEKYRDFPGKWVLARKKARTPEITRETTVTAEDNQMLLNKAFK
ncbi:MAG: hypothetical protein VB106_06375 [Clostridiaceae bacterium]|nr:hypothetical protein [Clostridiaceae bacterium]